jgi:putative N6-adenine-specific DNA methylase
MLGAKAGPVEEGGISFLADARLLYRANLHLRVASRVLVRVASFHASAFHELERGARRVRWDELPGAAAPFSLRVTCRKSRLYHSDAVAERIAAVLRDRFGAKVESGSDDSNALRDATDPAVDDEGEAGQLIIVRLHRDSCVISVDSSGAHLHKRGYREASGKAPLRETLAAALVMTSGWKADSPLLDPMCGSGTIPIEACLIARGVAPGIARRDRSPRPYALERWPGFQSEVWRAEVDRAREAIVARAAVAITGADRDAGAIQAAKANAYRAGVEYDIELQRRSISATRFSTETGCLISNPPYGRRVGMEHKLRDLYASLGDVVRTKLSGWKVALLSGNTMLERHLRLSLHVVVRTSNGGIPVRIVVNS